MHEQNLDILKDIFATMFDLGNGGSPEDLRARDFSGVRKITQSNWDSLAHVSLMAAIESEFGINLDIADYDRMTSFSGIELLLTEKGL